MPLFIGKVDRGEASASLKEAVARLEQFKIENKTNEKLEKFANAVFCFTGTMRETRSRLIQIVSNLGGTSQFSMTASTNILVNANDGGRVTEKIRKAQARKIPIINEAEFWELVNTVESNGR